MAANKYSGDPIAAGPIRVDYKAAISVGDMADLARLAELVIRYDAAFDAVLASKAAPLKVSLAERLLAGAAPSGKAPELAVRLLQSAADEGLDYAASRLAFLTLHGLGTAADAGMARTLAEQAAAKGEPFGLYLMAGFLEDGATPDRKGALAAYKRLLSAGKFLPTTLVVNRLMSGGAALATSDGRKLVEAAAKKSPDFVRSLAVAQNSDFGRCLVLVGQRPLEMSSGSDGDIRQFQRRLDSTVRALVTEGIADGSVRPCDPGMFSALLFGALNWVPRWYSESGKLSIPQVADNFMDTLIDGIATARR